MVMEIQIKVEGSTIRRDVKCEGTLEELLLTLDAMANLQAEMLERVIGEPIRTARIDK